MSVSEVVEIDTLQGMMDFSLILHTLSIAVCVDVILAVPHLLAVIYHTQVYHYHHPIIISLQRTGKETNRVTETALFACMCD